MPRHQRELKVTRHHSDYHIGLAVQQDFGSQHVRIAVQAVLPERIADHSYLFFLVVLLLREDSAHERLDPESREHSARKPRSIHLCRVADTGQFITILRIPAQALETARVAAVGLNIRSGHPSLAIAAHVGAFENIRNLHQSLGMRKRQGPQQHTFDNGEDGCRCPDAERKHQHGRRGKAGRLQQMAEGDSQVLYGHGRLLAR